MLNTSKGRVTTSVARGRADYCKVIPLFALFTLILTDKEVLEQVAKELQCNILECKRGTVEQFQEI